MDSPLFIHILSDFGYKSLEHTIYQAALLRRFPAASVVHSHQDFKKGDMMAPGIFLRLVLTDFPENCYHLCPLHIENRLPEKYILAKTGNQHFLGPDNGFLPIALADKEVAWFKLPEPARGSDIMKELFIPALEKINKGNFEFAEEEKPRTYLFPAPTITGNVYRLMVVYNDPEGNAYLNLQKNEFERVTANKQFRIRFGHKDVIENISLNYHDVKEGSMLAIFGLGEMLQISVNCGSAEQYLGLRFGSMVMMEIS